MSSWRRSLSLPIHFRNYCPCRNSCWHLLKYSPAVLDHEPEFILGRDKSFEPLRHPSTELDPQCILVTLRFWCMRIKPFIQQLHLLRLIAVVKGPYESTRHMHLLRRVLRAWDSRKHQTHPDHHIRQPTNKNSPLVSTTIVKKIHVLKIVKWTREDNI